MKSSVRISGLGLIVLFLISCMFLFINQQAEAQLLEKTYLGDDTIRIKTNQGTPLVDIQLIENTDHCLIDCYAILKIHPYQDIILPNGPNAEFDWKFVKEKPWMGGLESYHFELLEATEYTVNVPDYGKTKVNATCYALDSKTGANTTSQCETEQTVQTGSHQESRYSEEYKPFNFWGKTLKANQDYVIKLAGKKRAQLGTNNVDWIPTIKGLELNEWSWWNTTWKKCRKLTNSTVSQVAASYQSKVTFNNSVIPFADFLNDNFDDVRFTNGTDCSNDGGTEMPYWRETGNKSVTGTNATFWVKLNQANQQTMLMYYNASEASPVSNGANVFLLFDDFEYSDSPSDHGWDLTLNGGDISVNSSYSKTGSQSLLVKTNGNTHALNISSGWGNSSLECWFLDNGDYDGGFTEINILQYDNTTDGVYVGIDESEVRYNYSYRFYTPGQQYDTKKARSNGWHSLRIDYLNPKYYVWIDGVYYNSTDKSIAQPTRIVMGSWWANQYAQNWFDAVRVRKYSSTEPSWSIGIEESRDTTPPETTSPILKPDPAYTTDDLLCNATLTDNKATSLTAYWKWYKNGLEYLSDSTNANNGTNTLVTSLSSGNTSKGESWFCEVTPYDGNNYGSAKNSSNNLTILNSPPTHSNPLLTSTSGKNVTSDNLACYNQSTSDPDSDPITNIYNWYKNNQPLTVLNMPFENSARDYSGKGNNGILKPNATDGPKFVDGRIGKALLFDGKDDYVDLGTSASLKPQDGTYEAWVKINALPTDANVGGVIFENYQSYNGLFFSIRNTGKLHIRPHNGVAACTLDSVSALNVGEWYHVAGTIKGTNVSLYINGVFNGSATCNYLLPPSNAISRIGSWGSIFFFNGTIDEVKIYPYALSNEQIRQNYFDSKDGFSDSRTIVSQETNPGETYRCEITPNDGFDDGTALNSSPLTVVWNITFNIIDGEDGNQLTNVNIYCNNSWSITGVNSPYATGFLPEDYSCTFERDFYFNKTVTFIANSDKIVNVVMSKSGFLSVEEHHWLEALYNCLINGNCEAFEMWKSTNQTVFDIWKRVTRTNREVVIQENIISNTLSNTSNITINYTINIPFKEGYSNGELLPLRMFFWFHDGNKCYNQDKRTDSNRAESPYCFPLIAETLGPNNRTVSFTVDLRPNLPSGTYNITRTIEIDPLFEGVIRWTNYGQEVIGQINVLESGDMTTKLTKIEEKYSSDEVGFQPSITGNVIETTKEFFTNTQVFILLLVGMSCITIILHSYFKCKKKN